ncbi:esterase YqiA [Vibrio sp. SS-MA-C1-2]|uniref:esterase YqiA n=1 Tax=Vibrio sp. SS-MA-C1-2 TaxID=2908646 RepID=UPI001F41DA44|nr:esterase YqiA [Vibrio sp. SS-MA-C1-2]UJF19103.1 esterase YqiA [Vibrio sp. SS-MA-C1-2]
MPSLLLYIHGFNSSPLSHKAKVMTDYCQQYHPDIDVCVPQLASYPQQAAEQLIKIIEQYRFTHKIGLVGSSLGGFLATWLNAHYQIPVVVINPAVRPYELLSDYLGEQQNPYTNEIYTLKTEHIGELRTLDIGDIEQPEQFWLLQQTEDEVLDYRQAVEKYAKSRQTVEEGGDHSFVNFERYPAKIIQFLSL